MQGLHSVVKAPTAGCVRCIHSGSEPQEDGGGPASSWVRPAPQTAEQSQGQWDASQGPGAGAGPRLWGLAKGWVQSPPKGQPP